MNLDVELNAAEGPGSRDVQGNPRRKVRPGCAGRIFGTHL